LVGVSSGSNLIHVSGQVALDANGALVGKGNLEAQVVQTLANIKALVEAAGGRFSDIVPIGIFVTDPRAFSDRDGSPPVGLFAALSDRHRAGRLRIGQSGLARRDRRDGAHRLAGGGAVRPTDQLNGAARLAKLVGRP
jgi:hypothetical protein